MSEPAAPVPDEKDWTVVLDEPCAECGFDAEALGGTAVAALVRDTILRYQAALARPDAGDRPERQVWSTLEYAAHVRDVCRVFDGRIQLMLTENDPLFANWDQDTTALEERYWTLAPDRVAAEYADAAETIAATLDGVHEDQWTRPGRRSNGSVFTVDTLARYFAHDLVHHLHDVRA